MRMLFTACPMYGHVNPVLSVALAAHRAGHDVVVATGPDLVGHVERYGLVGWPVGPTHQEVLAVTGMDWFAYFAVSARPRAADLVPRAVRWRADLVVTDETELAGPVAAAVTGARHVVHGLGIMPPPRVWEPYVAGLRSVFEPWPVSLDAGVLRETTYLELCPPGLRPDEDRMWPAAVPLRPMVPPSDGESYFDALPYPDTVHLTLGTVFHGNREVLRTALRGLADLPVNVVVAAGPGVEPDVLGRPPAQVLVRPYVSYPSLLPKCRLVVSQAGSGVTLAALAHGVPHLAVPQGADQQRTAEACRDAGAGLVLAPDGLTAAAVTEAAARLLGEPSFAVAAHAVQLEIAAMPGPAAVVAGLTGAASSG
jgi:UDP:flavonoid glycosyltransferase YjiC (YdhE family)